MSNVTQTSLLAFGDIRGDLGPRQAAVADCIEQHGPLNNKQIAEWLHLPINSVTGRVHELRQKQIVKLDRVDVSAEGRRVMYWALA